MMQQNINETSISNIFSLDGGALGDANEINVFK